MKTLIPILLILMIVSCKKEEVKPQPIPENTEVLLNYRVIGFKSNQPGGETVVFTDKYGNETPISGIVTVDSCSISINNTVISNHTYGYHIYAKKGDILSFYIRGQISNSTNCSFYIWPDRNEQPKINYYYGSNGIIHGTYTVF